MRYKLTQEMARFFATSRGFTFSSLRIVYGVSLQVMDLPVAPSVSPVSVKNPGTLPRVLRSGITNFLSTPFHFRISAISKFLPAQITAWGAVDPTNRESEASAQTEFFARVSATASSETIGNQAWYHTSPPGGSCHTGTLPIQILTSIPWQRLQPYLQNVTEIPGETIRGKSTLAYHFDVSGRGLADLRGTGASFRLGTVQSASGTIYLRSDQPYYPQMAVLHETLKQDGYQYDLQEVISHQKWGRCAPSPSSRIGATCRL